MINLVPQMGLAAIMAQRAGMDSDDNRKKEHKKTHRPEVCECLKSGKAIKDEFYECPICNSTGIKK
jgi:hypothetical protein